MGAWDTANLERQRLIERLNAREAGLAEPPVGQRQLSRENSRPSSRRRDSAITCAWPSRRPRDRGRRG